MSDQWSYGAYGLVTVYRHNHRDSVYSVSTMQRSSLLNLKLGSPTSVYTPIHGTTYGIDEVPAPCPFRLQTSSRRPLSVALAAVERSNLRQGDPALIYGAWSISLPTLLCAQCWGVPAHPCARHQIRRRWLCCVCRVACFVFLLLEWTRARAYAASRA